VKLKREPYVAEVQYQLASFSTLRVASQTFERIISLATGCLLVKSCRYEASEPPEVFNSNPPSFITLFAAFSASVSQRFAVPANPSAKPPG